MFCEEDIDAEGKNMLGCIELWEVLGYFKDGEGFEGEVLRLFGEGEWDDS